MKNNLMTFFQVAGVASLVFFALAFTPVRIIPLLFSMPFSLGWGGALLLLFVLGAPFGFFLQALLFSHRDEWLPIGSAITGYWIGSAGGSFIGLKTAGAL